jgi:hypothetical protein
LYLKNSDSDTQYVNSSRCEQDKYVSYAKVVGGGENGDDDSPVSLHNNRVSKYINLFDSPSDGNNTRFW